MTPRVAVITPTYKREAETLHRCIRAVQWQTYRNITHYICHDGPWPTDKSIDSLKEEYKDVIWWNTPNRTNSYGAGVRQYVLDQIYDFDYLVHFDDDNLIFPDFVEEHVNCLEQNKDKAFSICRIVHNGPLPAHMGEAPKIISGIPPVFKNIDTLQVVVRAGAMRKCGWSQYIGEQGYCNDGYTYQRLGEMFPWLELPKLLAIHI